MHLKKFADVHIRDILIDIYFRYPKQLDSNEILLVYPSPIPRKEIPANVLKHPVENLVTDKRSVHQIQTENQINNLKRKLEQAKARNNVEATQIPG